MAKSKKSSVTNILVWVLMAMLVFGLAGFGVTSFGGNVRSVANVGQTVVDATAYAQALEQRLNLMREQMGPEFSFAEAEQLGITQAVLQQRIGLAALEEAAHQAKLSVGDDEVGRRIQQVAAFQGPDGQFNRESYNFLIERTGMTTATFEDSLRREAASTLLRGALITGMTIPSTYGETLFQYYTETRTITFAPLSEEMLETAPDAPTEAEVQTFYDENPALFTIPESKDITYAWLSPAMLAEEVSLTDEQLRAHYEDRAILYNRPERRMVNRLGFADMESAATALAAIEAGETTFEDLLDQRGLSEADVDLGAVSQSDLSTTAGEAVFALTDTGFAGPVESAVGPALFRVNAILTAQQTSFKDALPELRTDLAQSEAERLVAEEIEMLDDLLAGGATLEELAAETPMELGHTVWTEQSVNIEPPLSLPEFINAAAELDDGDFPEIIATSNGSLIALEFGGATPQRIQPLADVRDRATKGAAAAKLAEALAAHGETMLQSLDETSDFASLGLTPQTRTDITRQRPPLDLPLPVLGAVYDLSKGETRVVSGPDGVFLVRLDRTTQPPTDTPEAQAILGQLTQETNQAMTEELLAQFATAIANEAGVHIDQTALNAIHAALR